MQSQKNAKLAEDANAEFKGTIQSVLDKAVLELEKMVKTKHQEINKA